MQSSRLIALIVLVISAAAMRFIPHPPNFTPIIAIALFSGAVMPSWRSSVGLVFVTMLISDAILGFHSTMLVTYFSLALIAWIGRTGLKRDSFGSVSLNSIFCSVIFFLITNFGVWVLQALYPKTIAGLILCYTAAIPFFPNSLIGDLLYSVILFGAFAIFEKKVSAPSYS